MIRDRKSEELESKGLYRRAAARWAEVMMLADGDKEREHAANRRSECIHKAARPPATTGRVFERINGLGHRANLHSASQRIFSLAGISGSY